LVAWARNSVASVIGADRECHGAERADRRDPHDDADDAEEHPRRLVDGTGDFFAGLAHQRDGKTRQYGDQEHLQQVAARQSAEKRVRYDRHKVRDQTFVLGPRHIGGNGFWIDRGGVDVEAAARVQKLAYDEADRQRESRNHLEIQQRPHADSADLLQIAHRGDAVHDGAEDKRRDHHPDQRDETVAKRLHRLAGIGIEMPKHDASRNRNQHLDVEDLIPGTAGSYVRGRPGRRCGVHRSIPPCQAVVLQLRFMPAARAIDYHQFG
jgi:hypothetical protein